MKLDFPIKYLETLNRETSISYKTGYLDLKIKKTSFSEYDQYILKYTFILALLARKNCKSSEGLSLHSLLKTSDS